MKKAVILLSGGLDSTTCLAVAKNEGYACYALSFDYGQKNHAELNAAKNIANYFKVMQHEIIKLPIGDFGGSALTDKTIAIPDYASGKNIPVTYVPARNTIFLSIALGFAEVIHAEVIYIGVSAVDYSGYPDCRPEYIAAFQNMANLATKKSVENKIIKIETPLINLSKSATIQLGNKLGIDYALTISCYRATKEGLACGCCDSCAYRKKGFSEAHLNDCTRYII